MGAKNLIYAPTFLPLAMPMFPIPCEQNAMFDAPKMLLCSSTDLNNSSLLIRMFCGKTDNKEINRVQKRALSILLRDYDASFGELLVKNEEKPIHVRNLQMLMIEVYKSLNHHNPSFL